MNDATQMTEAAWQDIATAPFGETVEVKLGRRVILASLERDASLDEDERTCDQWQATTDDYPPCWTDGCCWSSNADGRPSRQPDAWRKPPVQS